MARGTVTHIQAPARRKAAKLGKIPDGQLICRSLWRHDFPIERLLPSAKELPGSVTTRREVDGSYVVTDECTRCGKKLTLYTGSGALYGPGTRRVLSDPEDWETIHSDEARDLGIVQGDFKAEAFRRRAPLIIAAAKGGRQQSGSAS